MIIVAWMFFLFGSIAIPLIWQWFIEEELFKNPFTHEWAKGWRANLKKDLKLRSWCFILSLLFIVAMATETWTYHQVHSEEQYRTRTQ